MTRRRWVQDPETLELIEITEDRSPNRRAGDAALWSDRHYDGLTTTDGVDISSRTKHREYMKQHGLATYDDFTQTFDRARKERDAYMSGERGSVNRADIERSIHRLMRR